MLLVQTSHSQPLERSYHNMAIGRIPEPLAGIQESILDAKGDLVTATAADTPARLAVGTNNQTLIADSTQSTGLKWGASATSTLTAKGDLLTATAANTIARLGVGANGTTLVADSAEATGLKWAAPAGGGKVLQVVQGTNSTQTTIASTSMTDTGLSASITPSSTSSKVLVIVNQVFFYTRTANQLGVYGQILRGSTSVYGGTTSFFEYDRDGAAGVVERWSAFSASYLDSPSTTSSTTYKTQASLQTTAGSASSRWQPDGYTNNILLLEIGA